MEKLDAIALEGLDGARMATNHIHVISAASEALLRGSVVEAEHIIQTSYPFIYQPAVPRTYSELEKTRVFARDGFINRYSGERLVFIGMLRVLSYRMPSAFPYHPNWKMESCHIAYWQLAPTLDHVMPVTRGGKDEEANWATTSMIRNAIKANWTLEELDWTLWPSGSFAEWDGLLHTFVKLVETDSSLMAHQYFKAQYRLAKAILSENLEHRAK